MTATASGAREKAEAVAGRMPGAAALTIVADDETGEPGSTVILGPWGAAADDFAENLQGG